MLRFLVSALGLIAAVETIRERRMGRTTVRAPSAGGDAAPGSSVDGGSTEARLSDQLRADPSGFVAELRSELKRDDVGLLAAGLAYYGMLALMPAIVAIITLYGLVADPSDAARLVDDLSGQLPTEARDVLDRSLTTLTSQAGGGLTVGAASSILALLWTVSTAFQALIKGMNNAYDVDETRGLVRLRLTAVGFAIGAIVVMLTLIGVVAVLPAALDLVNVEDVISERLLLIRWPAILVLLVLGLAVLFRYGPCRNPQDRWLGLAGAVGSALVWLVASFGFSFYVANFGSSSYAETYGAFAGVAILLLWLFVGGWSVLLGAELNAVLERRSPR